MNDNLLIIPGGLYAIAFTRIFPDGSRKPVEVRRSLLTKMSADIFRDQGGRYMIAQMSETEAQLAAIVEAPNGDEIVVVEFTARNTPQDMGPAVDRLVAESVRDIDKVM